MNKGITFEQYEAEKIKVYKFLAELDAKLERLMKESDVVFVELQKKSNDKLFIDYILAGNSISKLQDMKVRKLEQLKEMGDNIVFS